MKAIICALRRAKEEDGQLQLRVRLRQRKDDVAQDARFNDLHFKFKEKCDKMIKIKEKINLPR